MTEPKQLFEEIYDATRESAFRYITAKCLSISDIDDIYQTTFINVYNAIVKRGAPIEEPEAFVILIAKRTLAKYYPLSKRLRAQISLNRDEEEGGQADLPDDTDIEDIAADRQLIERINKEIGKKPPVTQKIIFMYYYRSMTIRDIAEVMEMSESAVKGHIYRTTEHLRRLYRKENGQ